MIATIVLTSAYIAQRDRLLREPEYVALEYFIARSPESHPIIRGTGGVRKARWARPGQGKSSGYRIIYYFYASYERVILLDIFPKNEKENLSNAERSAIKNAVGRLKQSIRF